MNDTVGRLRALMALGMRPALEAMLGTPARRWRMVRNVYEEGVAAHHERQSRQPDVTSQTAAAGNRYFVSIAALPEKYAALPLVIHSLLRLTPRPEAVVLWLDERYKDIRLPAEMDACTKQGLIIRYVPEIGPHRKWYYLTRDQEWGDLDVVTADDDLLYCSQAMQPMIGAEAGKCAFFYHDYGSYAFTVAANAMDVTPSVGGRMHGINLGAILKERWGTQPLSFLHLPVGGLCPRYPMPFLRDPHTCDRDAFLRTTPYGADVWMWGALTALGVERVTLPKPQIPGQHAMAHVRWLPRIAQYAKAAFAAPMGMQTREEFERRELMAGVDLKETASTARMYLVDQQALRLSDERLEYLLDRPYQLFEWRVIQHFQLTEILGKLAQSDPTIMDQHAINRLHT